MNYIYRLSSSSEFFDPNISFKTIKDGIGVTPKIYDPINFTPSRHIILKYCPLDSSHKYNDMISGKDKEELIKELKNAIDKIFEDKTGEYETKGKKNILLHGFFNLKKPLFESDKKKIYYKKITTNNIFLPTIVPKYISKDTYEKYKKKFKGQEYIREEELNDFLKIITLERRLS